MQLSTAYFGDFVAARRGGMLYPNTAIGIRSIGDFGAGGSSGRCRRKLGSGPIKLLADIGSL